MFVDADQLVELLDRQFEYLWSLSGPAKFIRLRRLIAFLHSEPRIWGFLGDLGHELAAENSAHVQISSTTRDELLGLWKKYQQRIRGALSDVTRGDLTVYGTFDVIAPRLEAAVPSIADVSDESANVQAMEQTLSAFSHWAKWITQTAKDEQLCAEMVAFSTEVEGWRQVHEHSLRHYREQVGSSGAWAYTHLVDSGSILNPFPPPDDDLLANLAFKQAKERAKLLPNLLSIHDTSALAQVAVVDNCARLLHQELRFRTRVHEVAGGPAAFSRGQLRGNRRARIHSVSKKLTCTNFAEKIAGESCVIPRAFAGIPASFQPRVAGSSGNYF